MVNYTSLEEFSTAAEELYVASPDKTRLLVKYRHCDAILTLKITDDRQTLRFNTDRYQDLRKVEKLVRTLMERMQGKPPAVPGAVSGSVAAVGAASTAMAVDVPIKGEEQVVKAEALIAPAPTVAAPPAKGSQQQKLGGGGAQSAASKKKKKKK